MIYNLPYLAGENDNSTGFTGGLYKFFIKF
jgi:hypothetical protein